MDTNEQPKRKYKKHKEGFKIAVDYKVNTTLKTFADANGNTEMYPIYIEVRAKGQRSYFKSLYTFFVNPSDFDQFKSHPSIVALFADESERIIKHLETYVDTSKVKFSIANWLKEYKKIASTLELGMNSYFEDQFSDILYPKNSDKSFRSAMMYLTKGRIASDTALALAVVLREYGVSGMNEKIEMIEAYDRVFEFLKSHSRDWLAPEIPCALCFQYLLRIDENFYNVLFKNKIGTFPKEESAQFHTDIKLLNAKIIAANKNIK